MKKQSLVLFSSITLFFLLVFSSCKKINEPTEIGDELIPPIDNINTFETFFSTITNNVNHIADDSTKTGSSDYVAIGSISSDPEFGQTNASAYFSISSSAYGTNPFVHRDSIVGYDSVVLSLSYRNSYGDTLTPQKVSVYEIAPGADFREDTLYKYNRSQFTTTGAELGSATFFPNKLNDTLTLTRKTDTSKVVNVLRIPLNISLAQRFASFDTTNTANGGYRRDSIFKTLFKGLAVKADPSVGNGLSYFNLNDAAKTKLTFYFRVKRSGKIDTTVADFIHISNALAGVNGQANIVTRTPAGNWNTYLNNSSAEDDKLFIQTAPGSFGTIRIPALDTFSNNVIHRAELIVTRIPSAMDAIFTPPQQLLLDRLSRNNDSAFVFEKDLISSTGLAFETFGGSLRSNNTYRFNITRYVQDIVTNRAKNRNHVLRIHAPLRTNLYLPNLTTNNLITVPVLSEIANGRAVLAGGNYNNPAQQMKLRIVYSKIN